MKEYLRHGVKMPIKKPNFDEWFNNLPKNITHDMSLEEIYKENKSYYDYFKHAYLSGKGIKIIKIIKGVNQ